MPFEQRQPSTGSLPWSVGTFLAFSLVAISSSDIACRALLVHALSMASHIPVTLRSRLPPGAPQGKRNGCRA